MNNVYIIGLGMLRFGKYPDRDVRDMAHEATQDLIIDKTRGGIGMVLAF